MRGKDSPPQLGKRYRDKITGFEGVATGRYEYLHGCVRWELTGVHPETGGPQQFIFDEPQIELVPTEIKHPTSRGTGGPRPAPTNDPSRSRRLRPGAQAPDSV